MSFPVSGDIVASGISTVTGTVTGRLDAGSLFVNGVEISSTSTAAEPAIVGGSGITVASGSNTTTITNTFVEKAIVAPSAGNDQLIQVSSGTNQIFVGAKVVRISSNNFSTSSGTNAVTFFEQPNVVYTSVQATTYSGTNIGLLGTIGAATGNFTNLTVSGIPVPLEGLNNVVEDTSPQLGGDLDTNGFDISAPAGESLGVLGADGELLAIAAGSAGTAELSTYDGGAISIYTDAGGSIDLFTDTGGDITLHTDSGGTITVESVDGEVAVYADTFTHNDSPVLSKASLNAITGSDGITITSGTNTTDVAGFYTEFTTASGYLQSQFSGAAGDVVITQAFGG